jgi:hypothetical protein
LKLTDQEREAGMTELRAGFMTPKIFHGVMYEATDDDGFNYLTDEIPSKRDGTDSVEGEDYETLTGWFCRLSADGYMDCTDWQGPYETEAEAEEALIADYCSD